MGTKTLLLVDDDADDLMMLQESIKSIDSDISFIQATDGRQALTYLEKISSSQQLPALIVLDINMPVLDGRELLPLLKKNERFNHIPVVIFTTSSNPADKAFCGELGVDLITKPFDMAEFTLKAKKLLSYCG